MLKMLKTAGLILLAVYASITLIGLQIQITANVRATRSYEQKLRVALQEKERYEEELLRIDDDDYLEEKAREKGFVKPNERVFIDSNKVK